MTDLKNRETQSFLADSTTYRVATTNLRSQTPNDANNAAHDQWPARARRHTSYRAFSPFFLQVVLLLIVFEKEAAGLPVICTGLQ